MSRNKGITEVAGLLIFALVVSLTIGMVYIVTQISFLDKIVKISGEARFNALQDDRGTAIAAFFRSQAGDMSYAEMLGDQAADGVSQGMDDAVEATLNRIRPKGRIVVYYADEVKRSYNTDDIGEAYLEADLALPGIKKGEVRVA